jgi:hypothetical protein
LYLDEIDRGRLKGATLGSFRTGLLTGTPSVACDE